MFSEFCVIIKKQMGGRKMREKIKNKLLGLLLVCFIGLPVIGLAKEKILFIPIDNRPVCLGYTVETLKAAGWDIETPPEEYVASYNRMGDPDKMFKWLEDNALLATDAVVSSDSLIYGGLVPSRTHTLPKEVLAARTQRLIDFKKKFDCLRLYVYDTVMRSPRASSAPAEPAYYSRWGSKIFRMGELRDKLEMGTIKKKEKAELEEILKAIPQEVQTDLYTRRKANLEVTEQLLQGVKDNAFNYFLLGKDDTAPNSDAHRDARRIKALLPGLPDYKIRFFVGADQLGLILLNRAVNKIEQKTPVVYSFYTEGQGEKLIPSYEDEPVKDTIRQHILAAGGFPAASPKRADFVMAVNTPVKGPTPPASDQAINNGVITNAHKHFLTKTWDYIKAGKNVGIADIAYGNGSDNGLVKGLFETRKEIRIKVPARGGIGPAAYKAPMAWLLNSYAGWNTASNTIGYTLGQGLLRPYFTEIAKNDLMAVRYLDEWAYEANVRQDVRANLVRPNKWVDGSLKPDQRAQAEQAVSKGIKNLAGKYFRPEELNKFTYDLPWSRMFEVEVKKAAAKG